MAGSVAIDKFKADSYLATHFPFDVITATMSSNRSSYGSPAPVNAKYPRSPHSHSHPKNDGRPTSPSNKALNSYSTGRGVLHVWHIPPRFLRIDRIFVTIPHGRHAQPQGRPLKGPRYCTNVRLDNRHASTMPNPPRLDLRKHASSRAHFKKTPRGALAWTLGIAITYSPSCWFDGTWFDATGSGPQNSVSDRSGRGVFGGSRTPAGASQVAGGGVCNSNVQSPRQSPIVAKLALSTTSPANSFRLQLAHAPRSRAHLGQQMARGARTPSG
ncbi:hypothetical protein M434DRAFT_31731 [Hypoxylon sp. CO27-5]|nr:hypothetical protein M434DRAFT_31731 [Hypoxylon sp. CO27-5]